MKSVDGSGSAETRLESTNGRCVDYSALRLGTRVVCIVGSWSSVVSSV